jgi:hypothetical protein
MGKVAGFICATACSVSLENPNNCSLAAENGKDWVISRMCFTAR